LALEGGAEMLLKALKEILGKIASESVRKTTA
jgi:hypothetical protein